jgi:hypothetical protein
MADEVRTAPVQQQLRIEHVDLPDLPETFADAIDHIHFDGQTLRVNFGVTRVEAVQPTPTTARRYPACRLVLSSGAAIELMNQMQRLKEGLIQAGVLKLPSTTDGSSTGVLR